MTAYIVRPDDENEYITSDTDDGFIDRIYPEYRRRTFLGDAEYRLRLEG